METEKSKSEAFGANLSAPFIKRPIMTTLVMLAILCIGIASYKKLPVSDLPDVDYPKITVSAILPGRPDDFGEHCGSSFRKRVHDDSRCHECDLCKYAGKI